MDTFNGAKLLLFLYNEDLLLETQISGPNTEKIYVHTKQDPKNTSYMYLELGTYERMKLKYKDLLKEISVGEIPLKLKEKIESILHKIKVKRGIILESPCVDTTTHPVNKGKERNEKYHNKQTHKVEVFIVNFFIHHHDGSKREHEEKFFFDGRDLSKRLQVNIHLPKPHEIIKEVYTKKKEFSLLKPSTWF